jgi:hypothetical protein
MKELEEAKKSFEHLDESTKKIIELYNELTEESKDEFLVLLKRYLLLSRNSPDKQKAYAWLFKNFKPVFKS